ncbi:hypothetical protein VDG1235_3688 [Verrucomicrobiia bacterium DG1235]|nr:hypothetical protein VDG1235_3688 [Verrucomicrobiae bacterium DG1235]
MKNFYCSNCDSRVFFTNTVCLSCGNSIGFDLESSEMVALPSEPESGDFKRCHNYAEFHTCNWVVKADSQQTYCDSCSLTDIIPDLTLPENHVTWAKIEEAKRRLVYNLERLGLRPQPRSESNPDGLLFRFLADPDDPKEEPILTGHAAGIVTLNVAEANDSERERRRTALGEPYRTLVGHLRHEVGHFYWDQLVQGHCEDAFRELFGDETQDYGEALKKHYKDGPKANWSKSHISSYAAAHPWEDWAETWAHYLHMMDSIGTAIHSSVKINRTRKNDPVFNYEEIDLNSFESIIEAWPALACLINSFNRSLGMPDAYPFITATPVIEKLKFIHDLIDERGSPWYRVK